MTVSEAAWRLLVGSCLGVFTLHIASRHGLTAVVGGLSLVVVGILLPLANRNTSFVNPKE